MSNIDGARLDPNPPQPQMLVSRYLDSTNHRTFMDEAAVASCGGDLQPLTQSPAASLLPPKTMALFGRHWRSNFQ
ncbi:unnamed protein product [Linum trigynum]|uniref:Uncharacterized protein n=1 Tax=Linum trigynum TaxID=586398 RepID=A0AAV2GBT0_9ROSI